MNNRDCIFCQIASGTKPSYEVYQNGDYMAFLDISPRTRGHMLVVPKAHHRWVDEVPDIGGYFAVAGMVARAAKRSLKADWVQFLTVGEEVAHAHIHIIPRYVGDGHGSIISLSRVLTFSKEELEQIAESIQTELKGGEVL